jgi:hypothetical protein
MRKPTSTSQDLRGGSLLALRIAEQSFIQEKRFPPRFQGACDVEELPEIDIDLEYNLYY